MKKNFSSKWQGSTQPRKQRKYIHNAPLHLKRKMLSATFDKELRKKYGMRNIEVRKGDEVLIEVGKFKKKKGKILNIDVKNCRVSIEGIQQGKKEGSKVNVWFNPSNLKIVSLNEDKMRLKKKEEKKIETKEEKTEKKVEVETKTQVKSTEEKKNAHKKK
jgi:large subunit ribosomal protein L24